MDFKNSSLAGFTIIDGDREVIIPGQYKGLLSEVTDPLIIEGMLARKSNLVAKKSAPPAKPANTGNGTGAGGNAGK